MDEYIGNDAHNLRYILEISHPIELGKIKHWEDMEKLWNNTFNKELKYSPQDHPILLTEAPNLEKEEREKITQILFESFNVPKMYL